MLRNFQKYKNTILMIAVWISLFWANLSLAQEYLNEDDFATGLAEASMMDIIVGILNWVLIFTGIIGLIGMVVSWILFLKDSSGLKRIKILVYPLILLLLLYIFFAFLSQSDYHFSEPRRSNVF